MKKEYFSPEFDIFKLKFSSVLSTITPSTYNPDPQDPRRDGDDNPGGDL